MDNSIDAFGADMYLAVRTARAGAVKGESAAVDHVDEVIVRGWRWGMASNSDAASRGGSQGGTSARRSFRPLVIDKRFDRASTALMAALASNDTIKTAALTMRKSGEGQQDFLKITLAGAVLVDIDYVADDGGNVTERLTFSYAHADVEYRVQLGSGQLGAATSFNVDV